LPVRTLGYGEMDVVHRDVLVEKNALVDLHTNNPLGFRRRRRCSTRPVRPRPRPRHKPRVGLVTVDEFSNSLYCSINSVSSLKNVDCSLGSKHICMDLTTSTSLCPIILSNLSPYPCPSRLDVSRI
jgi:hypothetical protein